MSSVYIAVNGSGLGHASRMIAIANELQLQGKEISFCSSSEAIMMIRKSGFKCYETPLIDVEWTSSGEVAPLRITILRLVKDIPVFFKQIILELRNLRSEKPKIVISDSKLSTLIASKILGIPTIVILNQLRIIIPTENKSRFEDFLERIGAEALSLMWTISEKVIIPDLPLPNTISINNVNGINWKRNKIKFVGFILKLKKEDQKQIRELKSELGLKDKKIIYFQISGPIKTRKSLIELSRRAAENLQNKYTTIISEGNPDGKNNPIKEEWGWRYEWCLESDQIFRIADVVVIRGGHSSICKSIISGKPMIVIPIVRHSEQYNNAVKINELEAGIYLNQNELTYDSLSNAINRALTDGKFQNSSNNLKDIADNMNSIEIVLEEIDKYLD